MWLLVLMTWKYSLMSHRSRATRAFICSLSCGRVRFSSSSSFGFILSFSASFSMPSITLCGISNSLSNCSNDAYLARSVLRLASTYFRFALMM